MAGRIIYLEVDDEITSAAARIRTAEADAARGRPAVRLARRDLADQLPAAVARRADPREAPVDRGRGSGDPGAGRVGRAAGLRLGRRVRVVAGRPRGRGGRGGRSGSGAVPWPATPAPARSRTSRPATARSGLVVPAAAAAAAAARRAGAAPSTDEPSAPGETVRAPGLSAPAPPRGRAPRSRPRRRGPRRGPGRAAGRGGIRTPWLIGGAILALALLIGAVGVYLLLPSATIAVTPRPEPVGPIQITVVADTDRDRAGCDRRRSSRPSS